MHQASLLKKYSSILLLPRSCVPNLNERPRETLLDTSARFLRPRDLHPLGRHRSHIVAVTSHLASTTPSQDLSFSCFCCCSFFTLMPLPRRGCHMCAIVYLSLWSW